MNKFDKLLKISNSLFPPSTMVVSYCFRMRSGVRGVIFYSDGMVDKNSLHEFVVRPLTELDFEVSTEAVAERILKFSDFKTSANFFEFVESVFGGEALLAIEGVPTFFSLNTRFWFVRSISEPPTDQTIKGPREGFTEDFQMCITMLKRRLKSPHLKFEATKIGRISGTNVALCYLDNVASPSLVAHVRNRLSQIDIDGVVDSSYLASALCSRPYSLIKTVGDTEKPDVCASRLLEGRVCVICDGSPIVLSLPYVLLEDLQSPSDYYDPPHTASFARILRLSAFLIGIFAPAVFVATLLFHSQYIPLSMLLSIGGGRENIPLSPPLEMLVTLFIFEVLSEASLRMPTYVGLSLSVVGALVLGDAATTAGLVSTPTILVVAISALGGYCLPDQTKTASLFRLLLLFLGGVFGVVGIFCGGIFAIIYLSEVSSFGVGVVSPFSPKDSDALCDGITKTPALPRKTRPKIFGSKNLTRKKETRDDK